MGTDTTPGGRRRDGDLPEITADAIRELLGRATAAGGATTPTSTDDATPTRDAASTAIPTSPRELQCPSCYGSGTQLCSSCYGSGTLTTSYTTTNWDGTVEYVTDQYPCGCSGGSVSCGVCGGRGVVYR